MFGSAGIAQVVKDFLVVRVDQDYFALSSGGAKEIVILGKELLLR